MKDYTDLPEENRPYVQVYVMRNGQDFDEYKTGYFEVVTDTVAGNE